MVHVRNFTGPKDLAHTVESGTGDQTEEHGLKKHPLFGSFSACVGT